MTGITHPHYLLDTNAAIAVLENDPAFEAKFSEGQQASVTVIVLGELYAGAEKSAKVDANLSVWPNLSAAVRSFPVMLKRHDSTPE